MSLFVNSNIASLGAQAELQRSTESLGRSFERLSSGMRINSARDDASGSSITTRKTAQVRGYNQAIRNANDAIGMNQVVDGALEGTSGALQQIRDLAVQAANDTYSSQDREDMWQGLEQLVSEIDRIAETKYNGMLLLGDSSGSFGATFHVGYESGTTMSMSYANASASTLGVDLAALKTASEMGALSQSDAQAHAEAVIAIVDNAIDEVASMRLNVGSMQNRLQSAANELEIASNSTNSARSRMRDTDVAYETSQLTRNSIVQQAGTAMLAQANAQPQLAMQLLG